MEAGGDPARFWALTPAEVCREVRATANRRRREHDERAWLAWHIAALGRTKKMPKLSDLMSKNLERRTMPQTPEQIEANLKLAFGYKPEGAPKP